MDNERNKRGKIYSSNQDEDHLEEQNNNKIKEPVATEKVTAEHSVYARTMGEKVRYLLFLRNRIKNQLLIFKHLLHML